MWELIAITILLAWACQVTISWWQLRKEIRGDKSVFDWSASDAVKYIETKLCVDVDDFITTKFYAGEIRVMAIPFDQTFSERPTSNKITSHIVKPDDIPKLDVLSVVKEKFEKVGDRKVEIVLRIPAKGLIRIDSKCDYSGTVLGLIFESPRFISKEVKRVVEQHGKNQPDSLRSN